MWEHVEEPLTLDRRCAAVKCCRRTVRDER